MDNTQQKTIWELQAELKVWHEKEYMQDYPTSIFHTGRDLASVKDAKGGKTWEELTPEEQEHKERVAHMLNKMLFSMGVNVSDNFSVTEE
jgi:hypothetical protein